MTHICRMMRPPCLPASGREFSVIHRGTLPALLHRAGVRCDPSPALLGAIPCPLDLVLVPPRPIPATKADLEHALEAIDRRFTLQSEAIERALGVHLEQIQGQLAVVLESVQECATKTELRELSDATSARFDGIDVQLRSLRDDGARKADAAAYR